VLLQGDNRADDGQIKEEDQKAAPQDPGQSPLLRGKPLRKQVPGF
jgi:hypothetical protein